MTRLYLIVFLGGLCGGLLGCTVGGVALAPSAGVTRYDGNLDSWAGTVAMTAYPAPEVASVPEGDSFRPTAAPTPSPAGGYVSPATGAYDWPADSSRHATGGRVVVGPSQPAGAGGPVDPHAGHGHAENDVVIETPLGEIVVRGLIGSLLGIALALLGVHVHQKRKTADA